jgi:hypothetical protein
MQFLVDEKLPYKKVIALRCYDGQVNVFTGNTISRLRLRQGRKLIAFKNPDGSYEGEKEAINTLKSKGGDKIFLKTSKPIEEKEYISVFRADDWEVEKKYLIDKLRTK